MDINDVNELHITNHCARASGFKLLHLAECALKDNDLRTLGIIADEMGMRVGKYPVYCEPLLEIINLTVTVYPESSLYAATYILETKPAAKIFHAAGNLWCGAFALLVGKKETESWISAYHNTYEILGQDHPFNSRLQTEFLKCCTPENQQEISLKITQLKVADIEWRQKQLQNIGVNRSVEEYVVELSNPNVSIKTVMPPRFDVPPVEAERFVQTIRKTLSAMASQLG